MTPLVSNPRNRTDTMNRDPFIPDWPTQKRFPRTEREAFRLHGVTITGYRPPLRIIALRLLARSIALAGVLALAFFFVF